MKAIAIARTEDAKTLKDADLVTKGYNQLSLLAIGGI